MTNLNQNSLVRLALITLVIFSLGRYALDGFLIPMLTADDPKTGFDFEGYYVVAYMARNRQNIYDPAADAAARKAINQPYKDNPHMYPPLLADLLIPLSFLSLPNALRVWTVLQQVFMVGIFFLLVRAVPWLGRHALAIVLILTFNLYPIYETIRYGQVNLLVLLLLCATLFCYRREQFFWAGVLVAVGAMLKLSPLILLGLFALQRQWRALAGFGVGFVVLGGAFLVINTPETLLSFFTINLGQQVPRIAHWYQSLAPATVIFHVLDALNLISNQRPVWLACVAVTLVILTLTSLKKRAPASLEFSLLFALWVMGSLMVAPLTWEHHVALLLLPLFVLFAAVAHLAALRQWQTLAVSYGLLYLLLAFDNLLKVRGDDQLFITGWWIFSTEFTLALFPIVRFFGLMGLFILSLVVLRLVTRPALESAQAETRSQELPALS